MPKRRDVGGRSRPAPTVAVGPPRLPRVGEIVGARYRINAALGTGGYGTVYAAYDVKLDLSVALKFLRGPVDPDQATWEARFGRAVVHPSIARIHDLGWERGVPYLVMELIEGTTLAEDLQAHGPCSTFQAYYLLESLCPALETAAGKGMLHGDLKPANIMVRADGTLALVDFGTALLVSRADIPSAGTPAYMAPEVLEGGPLTELSEIYSLGASVYEMLAGHLFHDNGGAVGLGRSFPKCQQLSAARSDLDERLCAVVDAMLQPEAAARPQSFLAVREIAHAASRHARIGCARTLLASLWSGSAALLVSEPHRNPDLYRLLLAQRPLVFACESDQAARDFLRSAELPSKATPQEDDHSPRFCASLGEVCEAARKAGVRQLVVGGPVAAAKETDVAVVVAVSERDQAWTVLRDHPPALRALPLTLQDLQNAAATVGIRSDASPAPAPGGGPYTGRSSAVFRPLSRAVGDLIRTVLEHPLSLLHGPEVSGRTSLVAAWMIPAVKALGWETGYVPRLLPVSRLVAVCAAAAGRQRMTVVDDHRQWPGTPEWPWHDETCRRALETLASAGQFHRLVLVVSSAHIDDAMDSARGAGLSPAHHALPPYEADCVEGVLRAAGAEPKRANLMATSLLDDGWLPFELQLALRWIAADRGESWSLDRQRKAHLRDALAAIELCWQEPARRIIAALATGRGSGSIGEVAASVELPATEVTALLRKMVAVRLLRGTWSDGGACLEIPRPFATPMLEILGPEFLEARALRQSLSLEISLSQAFETRIEGPRLALLRQLADSNLLDAHERAFLAAQTAHLRTEEEEVVRACEEHARAERSVTEAKRALRDLPAEVPLSTTEGYAKAVKLAAEVAGHETRCQEAWDRAFLGSHRLLVKDPSNDRARSCLADLHWRAMSAAEHQARWASARHHRDLACLYGGKAYRQRLRQGASVVFDSRPPASVSLWRLMERDGILVPDGDPLTTMTPCALEGLESGSWHAEIVQGGYAPARVAFNLSCGVEERVAVRLFRQAWLGDEMIHIPAGSFRFGGDPRAPGAGYEQEVTLGDYFLSRFPVTFRQYCDFLDALPAAPDEGLIPRGEDGAALVVRTSEGRFMPVPARLRLDPTVRYRGSFELEIPVVGVSWEAASRYCQWLGTREHRAYRLPSEAEWEKAARACQARAYPWGDAFNPAWCKMRDSRAGPPGLEPVGVFLRDVSPFGIHDMAGGVSEWCRDLEAGLLGLRVLRGGSWLSCADGCRAAARQALPEEWHGQWVGFRVCLDACEE